MIDNKNKMTAQNPVVGATGEQPSAKECNDIITKSEMQSNPFLTPGPENSGPDGRLDTLSLSELLEQVYLPRTPVVEGLLYAGIYLFVGAPKVGKSFLMAELSYHVAAGMSLWGYPVHQGTVLYLALEDDHARLQHRLSRMFGVDGCDELHFAIAARTLQDGIMEQLEVFVKEHPDTRMVIIDTLQKVREASGDHYSYANDYELIAPLKAFSEHHNVCLLLVHHTRKMESSDCFDMISGTNGLLGAADGAFVMAKKKRTDSIATLDIVGRDQQDQKLTLLFDREKCVWNLSKAETEPWKMPPDLLLEAVNQLLTGEQTEWSGTASELIERLSEQTSGIEMEQWMPNQLTRKLNISAEQLYNEYGIRYVNKRSHTGRWISLSRLQEPN